MAFAQLPATLSARAKARVLAGRVVAELIATDSCQEPFEQALAEAMARLNLDPVKTIAGHPEIDLADELRRERLRRFEARGCQQVDPATWQSETRAIAAELEIRLADRFRRFA